MKIYQVWQSRRAFSPPPLPKMSWGGSHLCLLEASSPCRKERQHPVCEAIVLSALGLGRSRRSNCFRVSWVRVHGNRLVEQELVLHAWEREHKRERREGRAEVAEGLRYLGGNCKCRAKISSGSCCDWSAQKKTHGHVTASI